VAGDLSLNLEKLFPNKSGKTHMQTFGSIEKQAQKIEPLEPHTFVLILDDLYTTGHTLRVTAEAVILAGGFPCGIAIA